MSVGTERQRAGRRTLAIGAAGIAAAAIVLAAQGERPAQAAEPAATPSRGLTNEVFRNGEAGFVVTEIAYVLGAGIKDSDACPAGFNAGVRGLIQQYAKTPAGQRKDGEALDAYERRVSLAVNTGPDGRNICLHPENSSPDPGWRMVSGRNLALDGIDLDGPAAKSSGGSCSHEEFRDGKGGRGIDNQFYRMMGCTGGYLPNGQANGFQIEMYTGSWGILVSLRGVDDLRNDPDVEVGLYANADPIQLSAARTALGFATYAVDRDARYRATTRGRIVDGVLTIDPVDVRFHTVVNSMTDDRVLRDARLRMTLTPDGGLDGFMAGYTPLDNMYDMHFGARSGKNAKGELAPERLRIGTSVGRAAVLGHSCNGAWHALHEAADGNRDPATGKCTSISTQYRLKAMPAFIVDVPTDSVNKSLTAG